MKSDIDARCKNSHEKAAYKGAQQRTGSAVINWADKTIADRHQDNQDNRNHTVSGAFLWSTDLVWGNTRRRSCIPGRRCTIWWCLWLSSAFLYAFKVLYHYLLTEVRLHPSQSEEQCFRLYINPVSAYREDASFPVYHFYGCFLDVLSTCAYVSIVTGYYCLCGLMLLDLIIERLNPNLSICQGYF